MLWDLWGIDGRLYRIQSSKCGNGLLRETSGTRKKLQNVLYGTEAVFSGPLPTWTDGESAYIYRIFKGWDKSTGYVTGNMDVYAQWDVSNGTPATSVTMDQMTPAQIYGVCQAGLQSSYFDILDYTDITLGHDYDFSNVNSTEIGTDVMLTGIPHDTFTSGGYYFDGTKSFRTDIKLLDEDSPSWTMAVDFQLAANSSAEVLVSASYNFRIFYNGANVMAYWGGASQAIGHNKVRDIVVFRHVAGEKNVYVYHAGDQGTAARFAENVVMTPLYVEDVSIVTTDEPLSFGGVYSSGWRNRGKGTMHWCKIWYDDLGDAVAREMAQWPRENIRFENWGVGNYYYSIDGENIYTGEGGEVPSTGLSFVANQHIGSFNGRGFWMNNTNVNAGGYKETLLRGFLNNRVYKAFPTVWQSIMKFSEIKSTEGSQSPTINTTYDKVYLPSYQELSSSVLATGYNNEVGNNYPIPWLITARNRLKFIGIRRGGYDLSMDTDPILYAIGTEPAATYATDIAPGSLWVNTGGSSVGYIFVSQEVLDQYGIEPDFQSDPNYANGGWVTCRVWWTRSANIGNRTSFLYSNSAGTNGSSANATNAYRLTIGFSI